MTDPGHYLCCLCGDRIETLESPFVFTSERLGNVDAGSDGVLWLPGAKAHKLCHQRLVENGNRYPSSINRRVNIPFRVNMLRALFEGRKTATSRTKRYGVPGDTFSVSGQLFRILKVRTEKLSIVARKYWAKEGCASPSEFIATWEWIHPRKGWDPEQFVFVHEFEMVKTDRGICLTDQRTVEVEA